MTYKLGICAFVSNYLIVSVWQIYLDFKIKHSQTEMKWKGVFSHFPNVKYLFQWKQTNKQSFGLSNVIRFVVTLPQLQTFAFCMTLLALCCMCVISATCPFTYIFCKIGKLSILWTFNLLWFICIIHLYVFILGQFLQCNIQLDFSDENIPF